MGLGDVIRLVPEQTQWAAAGAKVSLMELSISVILELLPFLHSEVTVGWEF